MLVQLKLIKSISEASGLEAEQISKVLVRTRDLTYGDFAFPCFMLAKTLKLSPQDCARNIAQKLNPPEGISKVEAVGPYI
ncbi:MAG: arginine--tRNA ligase, partial [SAR324 cluster bacterium]|nr:arginine--tRNA ligase [SAR324 cluster bacterium]